ncbi:MAG: glycine betaine ABC transporter substrate-binding protein [Ilumatobacteraceae bacterium]
MRVSSTLNLCVVTLVVLSACGDSGSSDNTVALKAKITISSTTDPVSELIAEIYGQSLEKAEFRVARRRPFDSEGAVLSAMSAGQVQLTAVSSRSLLALLTNGSIPTDAIATSAQALAIAKTLPASIKLATPSTAEDIDVVYCAKSFTDANTIVTLTDLGTKPGLATLAAPDGFDTATPLGGAVLKDTYAIEFKSVVPTEIAKTLDAVTAGTADCGIGSSGDPALSAETVTVLQDDKSLVPNDVIVPLLTAGADTADVLAIVDAVSARLTTQSFRALMARMSAGGASPEVVANEFVGNVGT